MDRVNGDDVRGVGDERNVLAVEEKAKGVVVVYVRNNLMVAQRLSMLLQATMQIA